MSIEPEANGNSLEHIDVNKGKNLHTLLASIQLEIKWKHERNLGNEAFRTDMFNMAFEHYCNCIEMIPDHPFTSSLYFNCAVISYKVRFY